MMSSIETSLRVLLIGGSPRDAEEITRVLREAGENLQIERVGTLGDIPSPLVRERFDVVIVAHRPPAFDAAGALTLLREASIELPFLVVSDEDTADAAVAMMRLGARDYVQRDNLARLATAVVREVRARRDHPDHGRASAALQQEVALRQSLMDASLDGMAVHNQQHQVIEANQRFADMLGYTMEEVHRLYTWDFDAVMSEAEIRENFKDLTKVSGVFETKHRRKDGTVYDVEVSVSGARVGGEPVAFTVTRDITERKRAEEARREIEERFRGVFQGVNDGILVTELEDGQVAMANRAMCAMLRCSEQELLRLRLVDLHPIEGHPKRRGPADQKLGGARLAKGVSVRRRDGSEFLADVSSVVLDWQTRKCLLSVYRDMTEFNKVEAQLRQAQKMEGIGKLAGGVAHDFNNILGVIVGLSELSQRRLRPNDPLFKSLQQIQESAKRGAALTRSLLAFSRKQTLQPRILDLSATVSSLRDMIERLIGEDIILSTKLAADIGRVRADPNQIEQVIINLVVNARDAMPRGGSLVVETDNVDIEESHTREGANVRKGPYVMLKVTDTGSGMAPETMEHIFEPFFTTKDSSSGSGLGLATAYGIVKQSGGYIWAYSALGHGSTIKVYLPRTDEMVAEESAPVSAQPRQSQGEKILLVEDEPVIGAVVKLMLEQLGYETTVVVTGYEALSTIEENSLEPDLILTDAIMPGMSGFTLMEHLRRRNPRLKVLLMSGYTDEGVARHGELSPDTPFIQKPFGLQTLAMKVREVLDAFPSKQ